MWALWIFIASMNAITSRSMLGVRRWRLPSGPTVCPWPRMSMAKTRLVFATLAAYIKIGIEHQDRYGERYVPSHLKAPSAKAAGAGGAAAR